MTDPRMPDDLDIPIDQDQPTQRHVRRRTEADASAAMRDLDDEEHLDDLADASTEAPADPPVAAPRGDAPAQDPAAPGDAVIAAARAKGDTDPTGIPIPADAAPVRTDAGAGSGTGSGAGSRTERPGEDTDRKPAGEPAEGRDAEPPGVDTERGHAAAAMPATEPVTGEEDALERAIRMIRDEVAQARARAREAEVRAQAEKARVERLDVALKALSGEARDAREAAKERTQTLEGELKTIRAVLDVLRQERDDAKADREKVKQERDLARAAIEEGAHEFERIEAKLSESQRALEAARGEAKASEALAKAAEEARGELAKRVAGEEKARILAEKKAAELEKRAKDAAQAFDDARAERDGTLRDLDDARESLEGLEKAYGALFEQTLTRKGAERLLAAAKTGTAPQALLQKLLTKGKLPAGGLFGGLMQ